jgi:hypothetical protein
MTVPKSHITQNIVPRSYLIGPRRALHARPGPELWRRVAGRLGASSADLKAIARTLPATLKYDGTAQFFTEMVGGRVGHADYFGLVSAMSNPVQAWQKVADRTDSELYRLASTLVSPDGVAEFARPQRRQAFAPAPLEEPAPVEIPAEPEPVPAPEPARRGRHSAPELEEPAAQDHSMASQIAEPALFAELSQLSVPIPEPEPEPEPVAEVHLEKADEEVFAEVEEDEPPAVEEPEYIENPAAEPEPENIVEVDFADAELVREDDDSHLDDGTGVTQLISSFAQRDRLVDRLGERDTVINKLVDAIGKRDEAIEHRDQMIGMLVERDRLIERLFARLDERDAVINRLAEAIGKRDKAIEQRDQMITGLIEKVETREHRTAENAVEPMPATIQPGEPAPPPAWSEPLDGRRTDRQRAPEAASAAPDNPAAEPFPSRNVRAALPGFGARPAAALSHRSRLQAAGENGFDQRVLSAAELAQRPLMAPRRRPPAEPGTPADAPGRVMSPRPPDTRP